MIHSLFLQEPFTTLYKVNTRLLLFIHSMIYENLREYLCRFIWNYVELFGIIWNYLELFGIIWNYLELFGIIWNYLELFGIIWDYLGLFGIIVELCGIICQNGIMVYTILGRCLPLD